MKPVEFLYYETLLKDMKIITWNIRHGGGARINKIIDRIKYHNADIVIITEYRSNFNGIELKNKLAENGYKFQIAPVIDIKKNTLMIASKTDFEVQLFENQLQEEYHRVVNIGNDQLSLYGVYFPQKMQKKKIFEFLVSEMDRSKEKPTIFIGDFNTGKPLIDEVKNTFSCSNYMDIIEQKNYADIWRFINKDKLEYSWYSNAGNGFRIDHAFINKVFLNQVSDCFYSHNERADGISDHSMMVLEIDI